MLCISLSRGFHEFMGALIHFWEGCQHCFRRRTFSVRNSCSLHHSGHLTRGSTQMSNIPPCWRYARVITDLRWYVKSCYWDADAAPLASSAACFSCCWMMVVAETISIILWSKRWEIVPEFFDRHPILLIIWKNLKKQVNEPDTLIIRSSDRPN